MTADLGTRDLSSEVEQASAEATRLQTLSLRAEAQASAADEEFQRALTKLREEFDVESPEAARELLAKLDQQVADELDVVRKQLAAADGS